MTTTISQILSKVSDQLMFDAVVLNVAKRHQTPEDAAETEKTVARARELAEQAKQKSKELEALTEISGTSCEI